MRYFIFFLGVCALHAQPSLTIHPSVITDCSPAGLGQATVEWSNPGGGPVRVLDGPNNTPFTGLLPATGSQATGAWVSDGLMFTLVDASGNQLASATAHVVCDPAGGPVAGGLTSASYFPLDIGNQWIYRVNGRGVTATYILWRVTGAQITSNQLWFIVNETGSDNQPGPGAQMLLRPGDAGRIYILQQDGTQALWLDPSSTPDPSALMKPTGQGPYRSPVGSIPDALFYQRQTALTLETGIIGRGIGLISNSLDMETGSSGGFVQSMDLVEARIDGHLLFTTPTASLQLALEAAAFDVSGGNVTNCALPCYFAACGLGPPPVDPPGTYKPCFQARVKLGQAAGNPAVDLDLLDTSGNVVIHSSLLLTADDGGDAIGVHQVPLYTAPNVPLAAGTYQLRASTPLGTASMPFQVK